MLPPHRELLDMPAPAGNQFWTKRSSHGRPLAFGSPDELWEACVEYFEWTDANPLHESQAFAYQGTVKLGVIPKMRAMTIDGLCIFLDIARRTWDGYRDREDFVPVTTRVEAIIRTQKFEGASAGLLNANIIARDLGLADRSEHTGKDGGPIQLQDMSDIERARRVAFALAKAADGTA